MLRKILVSGLMTVLLSSATLAADLPTRKAAPAFAPPPPAFSWTGFYIGVNGGFGGDRFEYPFTLGGTVGSAKLNSSGFLGGGQVGYNYQIGNWVGGLEADFDGSSVEGKISLNAGGASLSAGSNLEYFGTARARLGYAVFDRALVYATGGLAYGSVRSSFNVNFGGGGISGSETSTDMGWTIGGGLEYALTNNVTFKTEYLYADLGKHTIVAGGIGSLGVDTTLNIARAGLNYKF